MGKKQDFSLKRNELPQVGDVVNCKVISINKSFLNVRFNYYGTIYYGGIHISQLNGQYVEDINIFASFIDILKVKVLRYNDKYSK